MSRNADDRVPWVEGHTIGSVLRETASRFRTLDAVVFPQRGVRWSWEELDRKVDQVVSGLATIGVGPGGHVGIWSMNAPEWVVTQFAVGRVGAVLVKLGWVEGIGVEGPVFLF